MEGPTFSFLESSERGARGPEVQAMTIFHNWNLNPHQETGGKRKKQKLRQGGSGRLTKRCGGAPSQIQTAPSSQRPNSRFPPSPRAKPARLPRLPVSLTGQQMIDRPIHQSPVLLRGHARPSPVFGPSGEMSLCASTSACWRHGPGTRGGKGVADCGRWAARRLRGLVQGPAPPSPAPSPARAPEGATTEPLYPGQPGAAGPKPPDKVGRVSRHPIWQIAKLSHPGSDDLPGVTEDPRTEARARALGCLPSAARSVGRRRG